MSHRKKFAEYVLELGSEVLSNWKLIKEGYPGFGIYARCPDKNNIIRKITIQPSKNFPNEPPIIKAYPPFTDDFDWSKNGILHYDKGSNKNEDPWTLLVKGCTAQNGDKIPPHRNPLEALITELKIKYKFVV